MANAGRRTKRTPEVLETITNVIKVGGTQVDACRSAGISEQTFARWKRDHVDFVNAIQKAETECRIRKIARIDKAGREGTWQADAWFLERKYPDEFGQKLTLRVTPEQAAVLAKHSLSAGDAFALMIEELANAE